MFPTWQGLNVKSLWNLWEIDVIFSIFFLNLGFITLTCFLWQGLNVKSLRAFRVLRPLRLLSSIPSENLSKFFAIQWSWAPNDFRFTNCDQRDHHGDDPSLQHHVARHVPHHHLRHHGARALQRHFPQELHQRHNRYHNLIEKDGDDEMAVERGATTRKRGNVRWISFHLQSSSLLVFHREFETYIQIRWKKLSYLFFLKHQKQHW